MSWLFSLLGSSVGKKWMMAATGFAFLGFLAAHFAGNLTVFGGRDAFNGYAERLQSLGPILHLFRGGLIACALVHITTGIVLFFQNRGARPVGYQVSTSAGGRTLASRTMPYTGFMILAFVVFHLFHFTFVDKTSITIFDRVVTAFRQPALAALYSAMMIVVAFHVRHGFWSAFQTLGLHHPKYMPWIFALSLVAAFGTAIGFGALPILIAARM